MSSRREYRRVPRVVTAEVRHRRTPGSGPDQASFMVMRPIDSPRFTISGRSRLRDDHHRRTGAAHSRVGPDSIVRRCLVTASVVSSTTRPESGWMRTLAQRVVEAAKDLPVWDRDRRPRSGRMGVRPGSGPARRRALRPDRVSVGGGRGIAPARLGPGDRRSRRPCSCRRSHRHGRPRCVDRARSPARRFQRHLHPADSGFRFSYGPGSFERHVAEARRLGLPIRVVDDPTLAIDIDEPADLRFVEAQEELE